MFFNLSSLLSIVRLAGAADSPGPRQQPLEEIYDSSHTPEHLPFNTYNYCNAPHVSAAHYEPPTASNVVLKYATVFMRHHKRTPDNLYPDENALNPKEGWDCSDFQQLSFAGRTVPIQHETIIPEWHPFLSRIWNGTCNAGQLTAGGLQDAIKHGKDLWSVYSGTHGLLRDINEQDLYIRTSNSDRTWQVSGGLLFGMDPDFPRAFKVHTQPENIDSLVPSYPCPEANSLRDSYQSLPEWQNHLEKNEDLASRLGNLLGTRGLSSWSSWYDHYFDTFTSRTCHGHLLPCNSVGACVSQEDARRVHEIGHFEYNYIWNAAPGAKRYVQLTFGVMFMELARNFRALESGTETYKMRLYVGHDGSIIRLAAGLGLGGSSPLKWPALGSEIVMEVWETLDSSERFVRVLYEGTVVKDLSWISFSDFVQLLEDNVPPNIFEQCTSSG